MKICRFNEDRVGVVIESTVTDVTDFVKSELGSYCWPFPKGDVFIANLSAMIPGLTEYVETGNATSYELDAVTLISPVGNPGKIIAAPVNYADHLDESNQDKGINFGTEISLIDKYALFLKAGSSSVGPDEGISLPAVEGRRFDHEVELALVIGKETRRVTVDEALSSVAGYFIGLDITMRGTEDRSYRKSFDSFTVMGPWLVTSDAFGSPEGVAFSLSVNGEQRQNANTNDLVWSVAKIISVASHAYTLYPGDVILTGTPAGVGPIKAGDKISASIDRIGSMEVPVK
uniref:Fumarylacetoacetase-like C-terminal domain-containing protein n=1 Tax=Aquipseudomonas alcaligenes TaxID=43263 RepID=Q9F135_AQUAC|nr:unknown [Pseudomonas alcaligenes]